MAELHRSKDRLRSASAASSSSSVTEFTNEAFSESESDIKPVKIQVTDDVLYVENPLSEKSITISKSENLQNVVEFNTENTKYVGKNVLGMRKMYIAALVALLFAVNMGITATYSATATMDMQKSHSSIHPNDEQVSWIGSLITVGALIGGSAGGYFTNVLGRKGALILNTVPFVSGWLFVAYANSIGLIYAGRIITGFSIGIISVATPMYLVEISTPEVRGLLGASFQLFVVIGILIVAVLGSSMTWRHLAISGGLASLFAAIIMVLMPESPRWLMAQKRKDEAKNAILFLQSESFDVDVECDQMEDEIVSQPKGSIGIREFKAPTVYKPFILSILLMFFQQFSGINAVMFFTVQIFESAHSSLDSVLATIVVSIVQVVATLASSLLMDRAGRKILLLISASCMSISLLVFGGFDFAASRNPSLVDAFGWVPVVCLMSYISAFSIGFGPAPWLMVAEMTPARFRSIVSGIATALNWTFAFIVTKTFKTETRELQSYGVYWLYASICFTAIFFVYFFLPETKGKSAEEIHEHFREK